MSSYFVVAFTFPTKICLAPFFSHSRKVKLSSEIVLYLSEFCNGRSEQLVHRKIPTRACICACKPQLQIVSGGSHFTHGGVIRPPGIDDVESFIPSPRAGPIA